MLATSLARLVPIPDYSPTVAPTASNRHEAPHLVKQPYDAFLVLDVEATCLQGTDFSWPNEIIEWPVCLLQWRDRDAEGRAKELVIVDEFRSFVKPTWRPELSRFCTELTGITQTDVQRAPMFTDVLENFGHFLEKNGLIDAETGQRCKRFTWCTDGPCDIRDFVVKQCFISKINTPEWLRGDVLDVRRLVSYTVALQDTTPSQTRAYKPGDLIPRRRSLRLPDQLQVLGLSAFEGRQHSGIDDARNIARILTELAKRNMQLLPNTAINFARRWPWMGRRGEVLEELVLTA